jgi:hypothetical protein
MQPFAIKGILGSGSRALGKLAGGAQSQGVADPFMIVSTGAGHKENALGR